MWRDSSGADIVERISPLTVPVVAPMAFGVQPVERKVYSVEEARAKFPVGDMPLEQYTPFYSARHAGDGLKPYTPRHHDPISDFAS